VLDLDQLAGQTGSCEEKKKQYEGREREALRRGNRVENRESQKAADQTEGVQEIPVWIMILLFQKGRSQWTSQNRG